MGNSVSFQDSRICRPVRQCTNMVPMETQLTTHEQHILASDRALIDAAKLVSECVSVQKWPAYLHVALSMALAQAHDDVRLARNRVSAHRANDLHRFLARRGIVHSLPGQAPLVESDFEDSEYLMDRLLADLVTKVCTLEYRQKKDKNDDRD